MTENFILKNISNNNSKPISTLTKNIDFDWVLVPVSNYPFHAYYIRFGRVLIPVSNNWYQYPNIHFDCKYIIGNNNVLEQFT